ncbi:type II toxin-antitoxin system YhaV family toxin [Chroococcidiopsis sp. FACHB-1243]|uniref:type II toxin-antitoxin system YhaV family toxin n=1 Tax=Chroococcidiopsis sp. [FACHB-1243] TaxID=2692781 RepID=UPI00177BC955|nr:type II toxin-antitoxin system YhaV family toxin [Chroococcidiopsis sp. [FACHB-1243]]MBD2309387.1 type II toxin-antitoxin system YhaV family toxin [Chroococcidiopsis sp. [FACHB-1243]]
MIRNGWHIYFIKRLFGKQRRDLQAEVRQLKKTLPAEKYVLHSQVKLYKAVMTAINEKIPSDPYASHFALTGSLKKYGRVKGMGLNHRYRLFFRAWQTPDYNALFILWLGYPRKEGDKNDCYKAFTRMLERGEFPDTLDELLLESERD